MHCKVQEVVFCHSISVLAQLPSLMMMSHAYPLFRLNPRTGLSRIWELKFNVWHLAVSSSPAIAHLKDLLPLCRYGDSGDNLDVTADVKATARLYSTWLHYMRGGTLMVPWMHCEPIFLARSAEPCISWLYASRHTCLSQRTLRQPTSMQL